MTSVYAVRAGSNAAPQAKGSFDGCRVLEEFSVIVVYHLIFLSRFSRQLASRTGLS